MRSLTSLHHRKRDRLARLNLEALESRCTPATFTVTNVFDSGPGSLRQAIQDANANPGFDRIVFNITGPGIFTSPGGRQYYSIQVLSELPALTDNAGVSIDAATQPGYDGTRPFIEITGRYIDYNNDRVQRNQEGTTGLRIYSNNNVVRGFAINSFTFGNIEIKGNNNIVLGNYVNLDVDGKNPLPYGTPIIGVLDPLPFQTGRFNFFGISLIGGASNNVIGGINDVNGDPLMDAGGQKIGGTYVSNRNVIAGIADYVPHTLTEEAELDPNPERAEVGPGIRIQGATTQGNLIQGNYIGVQPDGKTALGNANGIEIFNGASNNFIGNPNDNKAGNLITGNRYDGIRIARSPWPTIYTITFDDTEVTLVHYDFYQRSSSKSKSPIPFNETSGIFGNESKAGIFGGLSTPQTPTGNQIFTNSIFGNGGPLDNMGIDFVTETDLNPFDEFNVNNGRGGRTSRIGFDFSYANDVLDTDSGPNGLQNHPFIAVAEVAGPQLTIIASLNSRPNRDYRIDVYANTPASFAQNSNNGQTWLGSAVLTTNATGNATLQFTVDTSSILLLDTTYTITATATEINSTSGDGTSRFSLGRPVTLANSSVIGRVASDVNGNNALDLTDPGVNNVTVQLQLNGGPLLTTTTNASGFFSFTNLPSGTHTISIVTPAGFQLVSGGGSIVVGGSTPTTANFLLRASTSGGGNGNVGTVIGTAFIDSNQNGVRNSGERGHAGVTVILEQFDANFQTAVEIARTTTDANGNFSFTGLPTGGYRVRQFLDGSFVQLTSNPAPFVVGNNQPIPRQDFGNLLRTVNGVPVRSLAVGADAGASPAVQLYNPDGTQRLAFTAFDPSFTGGVRVASGDLNGDGIDEIVVVPGAGGGPIVRVFSSLNGQLLSQFLAYEESFRGGLYVAIGDVNGDGIGDIVLGTGDGGGPRVQAFTMFGQNLLNFFAYEDSFRGGVLVSLADFNGDGRFEIITGTGVGGGPRVRVFDSLSLQELFGFFAYDDSIRNGVFVAGGDLTGNGRAEIVTGLGIGGAPLVRVFNDQQQQVAELVPYSPNSLGGVRVAVSDLNFDGFDEIITGSGPGSPAVVRIFDGRTFSARSELRPFPSNFFGGVFVG